MRAKKLLTIVLCVIAAGLFTLGLASCGEKNDGPQGVCVVFELEGGTYKNSKHAVSYYYDLKEGQRSHIYAPDTLNANASTGNATVSLPGYHVEGWYQKRELVSGEGETAVYSYSDPWNFETDTISYGDKTITLYAKWARNIVYTYQVCYRDETGKTVVVNTYTVQAGETFNDYRNYADSRLGYTAEKTKDANGRMKTCYFDENDEPWDETFQHPGGEESTAVQVFVHYIEGEFVYVSTPDELVKAAQDHDGVWLMNDITFTEEDSKLPIFTTNGIDFSGVFYGNSHTVSGFTVSVDDTTVRYSLTSDADLGDNNLVYIALFGGLKNATVKEVTFQDFTIDVNVSYSRIQYLRIAPIAAKATNSKVTDVTVEGTIVLTKTPSRFTEDRYKDNLTVTTDEAFCMTDSETVADVTVNMTLDDRRS